MSATVKVLGREYRIRGDVDPEHLDRVSTFLDERLKQAQRSTSDTYEAVVLAALNLASELLLLKDDGGGVSQERLRALIDLVESA